jgi:hypothetical protein
MEDLTAQQRQRAAAVQAAIGLLLPVWDRGEPGTCEIGDVALLARYIETGKDPYADTPPSVSPDAMRSHP